MRTIFDVSIAPLYCRLSLSRIEKRLATFEKKKDSYAKINNEDVDVG